MRTQRNWRQRKMSRTPDETQLQLTCEELCASVAEAPISVGVRNDGNDDIVWLNSAALLQFLTKFRIQDCFLSLGARPACYRDDDSILGSLYSESRVLNDEIRF